MYQFSVVALYLLSGDEIETQCNLNLPQEARHNIRQSLHQYHLLEEEDRCLVSESCLWETETAIIVRTLVGAVILFES